MFAEVASVVRWQARTATLTFVLVCIATSCTAARSPYDRADAGPTDRDGAVVSSSADSITADPTLCGDGSLDEGERCDPAITAGQPGACPKSCERGDDPCAPSMLRGVGCSTRCEPIVITERTSGDDCCPTGATVSDDRDCTKGCGNGTLELGETCDPPGSCPVCPASSACVRVDTIGSADTCTKQCRSTAVTECRGSDKCCPRGCTSANDDDCSARCGDGVVDEAAGETCEDSGETKCPASCDDGDACTEDLRTGSEANCSVRCEHIAFTMALAGDACCPEGANANVDSDCKPACGNRVVEAGEACDDGNTNGGDGCNGSCAFETRDQMCMIIQSSTDACASCVCEECDSGESCFVANNPASTAQCTAIARCFRENRCDDLACYCGQNLPACLGGNPNGPCREVVETAAGTDDVRLIAAQLMNPNFVAGRALRRLRCERFQCQSSCSP